MARTERGAVTLTIGDETYTVTPTFKAGSIITAQTGMGIGELSIAIQAMRLDLIAVVLSTALVTEGYKVKGDDLGEAILDSLGKADSLLSAALQYLLGMFPSKQKETGDTGKKPTKTTKAG